MGLQGGEMKALFEVPESTGRGDGQPIGEGDIMGLCQVWMER